jgi:hypothetical protein
MHNHLGQIGTFEHRLNASEVTYFALFLISTALMVLSGSAIIVIIWVFIWLFAKYFSTRTKGSQFLMFWLGFTLFYPDTSSVYTDLNEQGVVKGLFLLVFILTHFTDVKKTVSDSHLLRAIFLGWIGWGLAASSVVLLAWLTLTVLNLPLQDLFAFLPYYSTTGLKSALPVVPAVVAAVIPIVSLKRREDYLALSRANLIGTTILLVLSFLQLLLDTRFVPSDYYVLPGRVSGFSTPGANEYATVLFFPLLFLFSMFLERSRRASPLILIVGLLGILTIALTETRAAYISFTIGFVILLFANRRSYKSYLIAISVLIFTAFAFKAFGILADFAPGSERLSDINLQSRFLLYQNILNVISINPWFGAFPGGYSTSLIGVGYTSRIVGAENTLLAIAAQFGIPMAAMLLTALVGSAVYGLLVISRTRQIGKPQWAGEILAMAKVAVSLSVVYFVHGLTAVVPPDFVFFIFGLSIAAWSSLRRSAI